MKLNLILRAQVLFPSDSICTRSLTFVIQIKSAVNPRFHPRNLRKGATTSVYSHFVFRRCIIYTRLASIENSKRNLFRHRRGRKNSIKTINWLSIHHRHNLLSVALTTLTNLKYGKYRQILDVWRQMSSLSIFQASPRVDPTLWTRVCTYRCRVVSRVNWGGAQVRVTAPPFTIDDRCNCIAISWKRGPLINCRRRKIWIQWLRFENDWYLDIIW